MADQYHYQSMPLVWPIPTDSVPNTPSPAADSPPATMPQTEINSNNSSGSGSSSKDQINGMAILVAFVVMLSLATLLLTFCICVTLRRSRRGRAGVFSIRSWPPAFISGAFGGSRSDSSSAPSGLDPAAIRRLPMTVIAAKTESASAAAAAEVTVTVTECSVCISEFRAGDKARTLPACGHMFHLDCIDTWLLSHSTCPLCRTSVVVPVASPPPPPAATLSAAELTASTSVSSSSRSKAPSVGGSADAAIDIGDDVVGVLSREGEETRPSGRRGVARILSRGRDGGSGRVHPQPGVPAHDSSTSSA